MATTTSTRNKTMSRIERIVRVGLKRSGVGLTQDQIGFAAESVVEVYDEYVDPMVATGQVPITPTRVAILKMIANGYSNDQIGKAMHLSRETVKVHLRNLYRSFGVQDRAHAIAAGFYFGFLKPEDITNPLTKPGRGATGVNRSGQPFRNEADQLRSISVRLTAERRMMAEQLADRELADEVAFVDPTLPRPAILRVLRAVRIVKKSNDLLEDK